MLSLFKKPPAARNVETLHRRIRALKQRCELLLSEQERVQSDNRFLHRQLVDLKHENARAFELIAKQRAQLMQAQHQPAARNRDCDGRFAR